PAPSITFTRSSKSPAAGGVQEAAYGAAESTATSTKAPPPRGRYWKVTAATPEPESSAVAVSVAGPVGSEAPADGAVSVPVGGVLSTRTERTALAPALPVASIAIARRS